MLHNIKKIFKNIWKLKKCRIFASFIPRTVFLNYVCVAVFFAANFGYQIPLDCCTSSSVIVRGRTGGDSLSAFKFLKFFVQ